MFRFAPGALVIAGVLVSHVPGSAAPTIDADLAALAALPGEPHVVSAAGVTRGDTLIATLENPGAFDAASARRVVLVGGLDGDRQAARAILEAVRWFKTAAPARLRHDWILSALPLGDPDGRSPVKSFEFPPMKGFFDDPEQPESRYVWRWIAFQAPDLVIEFRRRSDGGGLARALSAHGVADLGMVPSTIVSPEAGNGGRALRRILAANATVRRSPLHEAIATRVARGPLDIARVLARRYPEAPAVSYIPAVAWANTLRVAAITKDDSLRTKVRQQIQPWITGEKKPFGDQIALASVAGTMIFAEIAIREGDVAAQALAAQGADLAATMKDGVSAYARGWTDDMFMASALLAAAARLPSRANDLDAAARLLASYASRLQRPDGVFIHASDAPHAWGRGNGFAALGLIETLTVLPADHPLRATLMEAYRRQMAGLKAQQAPDGAWREIIDQAGSYREESATAMLLTAMARGVRLGWLDPSFLLPVQRAWRALAAHLGTDGTVVDVCTSTGAGPTRRYYYDRPALGGADDRGGAMALLASVEMHQLPLR